MRSGMAAKLSRHKSSWLAIFTWMMRIGHSLSSVGAITTVGLSLVRLLVCLRQLPHRSGVCARGSHCLPVLQLRIVNPQCIVRYAERVQTQQDHAQEIR